MLNYLIAINPDLETGLFIGGQYSENTKGLYVYVKDSIIKNDTQKLTSGFRFNHESEKHKDELNDCYKSSFKTIFKRDYDKSENYENISNEQFKDFLTLFHQCAITNANPVKGIGPNIDIGIIREGKFEWIVKNNFV